jgi:hypothetical protein
MQAVSAAAPQQGLYGQPDERVETGPLERKILWTRVVVGLGLLASTMAMLGLCRIVMFRMPTSVGLALIYAGFAVNIAFLMYGSVFYQITQLAYLKRLRSHRRATREELEQIYDSASAHRLAILVPSYREEPRVVRLALMSAALTEYPDRRVVLLIDDPPNPLETVNAQLLADTRELIRDISTLMQTQGQRFKYELASFERRCARGRLDLYSEARRITRLYLAIARWFEQRAAEHEVRTTMTLCM